MTYKSSVSIFIKTALSIVLFLPLCNISFMLYDRHGIDAEMDKKMLFSTDNLEGGINYLFYKIFNKSMFENTIVFGLDDYIFLGNKYNNVIDAASGKFRLNKSKVDHRTDKIVKLQKWYEKQGIKFVLVLAANKHTIYKEKLRNHFTYNGKTITDDIVTLSLKKGVNILDLRDTLLEHKNEKPLYNKDDSHWNNYAAAIAYEKTIDYINHIYGMHLEKVRYSLHDKFVHLGSNSRMLKIEKYTGIVDNIMEYEFERSNICILEQKDIDKRSNDDCRTVNKNIYTNMIGKKITNVKALNPLKLLFLTDSFSGNRHENIGNSILYNETFATVYKFHYNNLHGNDLTDLVKEFMPDMVIYQVVERSFHNFKIENTM